MSDASLTVNRPQIGMGQRDLLQLISDKRRTRRATALASAVRTATTFSGTLTNPDCAGLIAFLSVTGVSGAGTLKLDLELIDELALTNRTLIIGATPSINATGLYVFQFHPALQTSPTALNAGNTIVASMVSRTFAFRITHSTADNMTYSLQYDLIP